MGVLDGFEERVSQRRLQRQNVDTQQQLFDTAEPNPHVPTPRQHAAAKIWAPRIRATLAAAKGTDNG